MLNPKHQRYADRLRDLAQKGEEFLKHLESTKGIFPPRTYVVHSHQQQYQAWLTSSLNIITLVFGNDSIHAEQMRERMNVSSDHAVIPGVMGVLKGGLDDLESGFLASQEFLLVGDVLDSVLERAKELNSKNYKDPAAVLARVALEDALRRIAREEGLDSSGTPSRINDDLRKAGRYAKPQWRRISACLDVGNAAAHGDFDKYTQEDVTSQIDDIERFLANELHP